MSKNNVVPEELSSVDKVLNDPKLLMRAFEFIANRIEEMEKEEDRTSGYQIHYIGPWRIVVDNKSDLLPDEVLRKTRTDILVFAGGRGSQAGIFFRPDNEVVHWAFNLDGLHKQLLARSEPWVMPDRNSILCGRSNVTESELIGYIQRSLNMGGSC